MQSAPQPRQLGRYEVVSLLAQGGMAELYLAKQPGIEGFHTRVVVTRVRPPLARARGFVDMFLGEARLAATLHHQNVVQVHDIGQDAGGYFFAMEYLHGADVGEIMRTTQAALPLDIALEIVRGACAGLHYAHQRTGADGAPLGIVHRDVSPQNLFVTFDGGVKVLDFGIAKAAQHIAETHTRSGTLRGKLPYMSPEQCQNQPLDRRSDVFSLAVVLWEITVGQRLFGGAGENDFEVLKAIVERPIPPPSSRVAGYPPELERIVMKGLARDRAWRHQTADELGAELDAFSRASGRWPTARDLATFMRTRFAERAATSLQMTSAELAATANGTRVAPVERETVDLPKPDHVHVVPPPPVMPQPASRGIATWLVIVLLVLSVALAVAVTALVMRGGSGGGAASGSAASVAPGRPAGPGDPIKEDQQWIESDDYLVSWYSKFEGGRQEAHVAKMIEPPDMHGIAAMLDAKGETKKTGSFWKTHMATREELQIGKIAFCPSSEKVPDSKDAARKESWYVGRITDIAVLAQGKVTIADIDCPLAAARVAE